MRMVSVQAQKRRNKQKQNEDSDSSFKGEDILGELEKLDDVENINN